VLKASSYGPVTRFDLARTLLGRGRYWTTCYLVDGLLVDSGCAHTAGELSAAVADRPLHRVFNSHSHEDHIGANGPLQRSRGVEVLAHPLALPVLADPRPRQPLHPYRRVMWGWPEPSHASPVEPGETIATAEHRFEVVATPGHSPEHLCLFEPTQGWLFTGDLYVGGLDRALRSGYDVWQIVASLKRVAALGATTLFPGAARVPDQPARALADKIEHLQRLGERVVALDREGRSERQIVRALLGPPIWIERITLGHFSRRNLVRSYLGRNEDPAEVRWKA
jgi:glyoxylase-like metal-dependent hydrolase (beta-lactamase superfamily II)